MIGRDIDYHWFRTSWRRWQRLGFQILGLQAIDRQCQLSRLLEVCLGGGWDRQNARLKTGDPCWDIWAKGSCSKTSFKLVVLERVWQSPAILCHPTEETSIYPPRSKVFLNYAPQLQRDATENAQFRIFSEFHDFCCILSISEGTKTLQQWPTCTFSRLLATVIHPRRFPELRIVGREAEGESSKRITGYHLQRSDERLRPKEAAKPTREMSDGQWEVHQAKPAVSRASTEIGCAMMIDVSCLRPECCVGGGASAGMAQGSTALFLT